MGCEGWAAPTLALLQPPTRALTLTLTPTLTLTGWAAPLHATLSRALGHVPEVVALLQARYLVITDHSPLITHHSPPTTNPIALTH